MASLKEVRGRIVSVKSTQQITKAMKMVAAAKLKRAQTKIQQMRPYAVKMNEMLANVSGNLEGSKSLQYYEAPAQGKILVVFVSSDRGLCGSFNSSLQKHYAAEVKARFSDRKEEIEYYCIGKKGKEALERQEAKIVKSNDGFFTNLDWDKTVVIADELISLYQTGAYSEIHVLYNEFRNAATIINTLSQWLPMQSADSDSSDGSSSDYIFEPSKVEILDDLVPRSLKISLFKALLDSNASEHGSRMTAMDSATENAEDLLKNLSIEYNKARQAAITTEILEIVGGAEALSNA